MAVANVPKGTVWLGAVYKLYFDVVTGPSSYSAGGFTVDTGLSDVKAAIVIADGGYKAEVAGISGGTITIVVRYYDYDAGADGTAIEVPDGTDLSGVHFYIIAIGE